MQDTIQARRAARTSTETRNTEWPEAELPNREATAEELAQIQAELAADPELEGEDIGAAIEWELEALGLW